MGTELNLDLLDGMGFPAPDGAGPNDLLVAIRADDDEATARGKAELDAALARSSAGGSGSAGLGAAPPPRTSGSAARRTAANLSLVSVPGPHAFSEAMDALEAGLNVMLFSDNVPVEQEIRLKDEGAPSRAAGHGAGLRHSSGVGRRAGVRQHRAARAGRHRGRVRHRRPAADVPARRGRCRGEPLPRRRRTRPLGRRRRPVHPAGARHAGRGPRHRAGHRRVQAARQGGGRRDHARTPRGWPRRCSSPSWGPGSPT